MRSRPIWLTSALLAAALALPAAGAQAASPKDFVAISKLVKIEGGPKRSTFEEKLFVKGRLIGRDRVVCKFGKATTCVARFSLDEGTIVGKGSLRQRRDSQTLPIVNGTGRYADAGGVLIVEDLPKKKSRLTFDFSRS